MQCLRQLAGLLPPMSAMTGSMQSRLALTGPMFELLDAPELSAEAARPRPTTTPAYQGHTGPDAVKFCYRPDQLLFEQVSLQALPGPLLAQCASQFPTDTVTA